VSIKVHARFQAARDEAGCGLLVKFTDDFPESRAAERHRAEADFRNKQSGIAELIVFHGRPPMLSCRDVTPAPSECATIASLPQHRHGH
jgi:hypothetical protein